MGVSERKAVQEVGRALEAFAVAMGEASRMSVRDPRVLGVRQRAWYAWKRLSGAHAVLSEHTGFYDT